MLITITVRLVSGMYAHDDWACELEIDDGATLHELHDAIQQAVRFNNDHMYSFFIARSEHAGERLHFDGDEYSLDAPISDLFPLPRGKKLFYWFDFGDDWIFQVSRSRKKPRSDPATQRYPRLTGETGTRPVQYEGYDPHAEPEW
ncbi:hypothetical protein Q9290_03975 [Oceanimonas sp. CHS3-5]|uniref:IS1096 element passenger TnpR family protein n=1 Tax=Oceanimonas sp. CHS3-5 TaxID=3068186 RepID=UPI00273E4172|nr:hypothetical protein [Oceanimonas sp. CHS3-5]MDP5291453.1 hypothetical protein [Oceanimonas sp. CHS3-5]